MKEKAIISSITLAASLLGYSYAKENGKDTVPIVMISGCVGALIGEMAIHLITKKQDKIQQHKRIK